MASILRSSKFVRYIAGFARNIVVNTPREFDGSVVNNSQCLCGSFSRSFASHVNAQQPEHNLDTCIRRLDQDVRRTGRISIRDIEDALEEIRNARSPTTSQSLLVIRCCGNLVPEEMPETRTKLVQEIWNTLKKLNVPMDISHYNALLRVYLENEYDFSPTEFLDELEKRNIEPNRVTYQRLIGKYCQIGDISGATRILQLMRDKELPVNESIFNSLIIGHAHNDDMESAHGILSIMSQAGLDPSAETYTTLMAGYAKSGNIEMIKKVIEECESKDIYLLDKDYYDVIYALAINDQEAHIPEVLTKVGKGFGFYHDTMNLMMRLVNKGREDAAFLLVSSVLKDDTNENRPAIKSYLKQLVKAKRPIEKIRQICKNIEEQGLHTNTISFVTEKSLQYGDQDFAYEFLGEMQKNGQPIRNHYFWPLLLNQTSDDGIFDVLVTMTKFGVQPNSETIREYVLPNLKGKSSEIISKLRVANISLGSAACSLAHSLIQKNDLKEAALIVKSVSAYYQPDLIRRPLTAAFYKTHDVDNYITIIRHVYESIDKKLELEYDDRSIDKNEIVGKFILDLSSQGRQIHNVIQPVLEGLVSQGLSISTSVAESLQEKIGEKMTSEISALLAKLSSGELTPVPVEKKLTYVPSSQMNIPQLERLVQNLSAKNQDTRGLKRQLLSLYYREKELEKMKKLCEELDSNPEFTNSTGIYAQLLDTCAYHEKYDETMEYLKKLEECDSDFRLDDMKVIRVATVMVKNGKLDQAVEFLSRPREVKEEKSFVYNSLCWRLLNHLAEQGDAKSLQLIFDTLLQNSYLEINNVNLGPLVKVHLVNKDINKALEQFDWCCNQFRCTPWKNELTCHLIQAEDAERLQKLTDLSTSVHGEINSLYDLVFAFVECGRVRQARKILETPGLQSRPQRINVACQRYREEGKIEPLEGLREATKHLNHIDRNDIYYQLLLSYIKQNDVQKAEALWMQMQEEDLPPSDEFLLKLGKFLQANNVTPKFVMPQIQPETVSEDVRNQPSKPQMQYQRLPLKKDITVFRNAIKAGDVDNALEIKRKTKEALNVTDVSLLIEKLVQSERYDEAIKITLESLDSQLVPIARVFRFLLNKLAGAGNVKAIEEIGKRLDAEAKKNISFDNRICHANMMAGTLETYLNNLESELDNAKDTELETIGEKFPRGGAIGILERFPELHDTYENLAVKYSKRGIVAPMNVLWSHYFINNLEEKAERIWKEHLEGAPRIMFQRVVQHAREVNDEKLAEKLITHLKATKVTEGAIGNAYSCFLDVLYNKGRTEDVVNAFEKAIQTVSIDHINRTAVLRVKETFEKMGKPFNHPIPAKHKQNMQQTSSSSSSGSSSDDEPIKQKQTGSSSK